MWKIILNGSHIHTSSTFVQVLNIVDKMHSGQTVTGKPLSSVYLRFALMVKVTVGHIGNPTGNKVAAVGGSLRLLQKPMQVLGRRVLRYQGGIVAAFVPQFGQRRESAFGNKLFKCNEIGRIHLVDDSPRRNLVHITFKQMTRLLVGLEHRLYA